jgi:Ca-activated chloride channel family protein
MEVGVEGGVAGSVEGGVIGGVVGGLPETAWESQATESESYSPVEENTFLATAAHPLSTFSIDVDRASYANVRRFLTGGQLPPKDAVRIEELVNYFRYDYPPPTGDDPFSVTTEVFDCPWTPEHRLLSIGLQGRRVEEADVPPRNLVFLLDVSGSMQDPRKLPLLKAGLGLLVDHLRPEDSVAVVVYAGSEGLVLDTTPGDRKEEIREALERLDAGGATAGAAGIALAYRVAAKAFVPGGINRVILATDGDFNVGVTGDDDLVQLVEKRRRTGVSLSVLGFGMGNLKDSRMEKLAQAGNGNYAYIDSLAEARKVLVEEAGGTLVTIAKDVKIQVEFNPQRVASYRLLGYENRRLAARDFDDDKKDAGEIGAGHSVTALYEIVPEAASGSVATVRIRHQGPEEPPDGSGSRLITVAAGDDPGGRPSDNARFATAVVGFGMLLRDSPHKGELTWERVTELAEASRGEDREGYRAEFIDLVRSAETLAAARLRAAR